MGLTKKIIDRITLPEFGQALHWDDEIPGFALKVSATGLKSFVLDYRVGGKRFQKVIGRYGEITPTEARQMALEWRSKIGKGIDPATKRETGLTFERMKLLGPAARGLRRGFFPIPQVGIDFVFRHLL